MEEKKKEMDIHFLSLEKKKKRKRHPFLSLEKKKEKRREKTEEKTGREKTGHPYISRLRKWVSYFC